MKKLTKNAFLEMLKKDYLIGDVKSIHIDGANIYVVYPFYMVRYAYNKDYGWSFSLCGEATYSVCKHHCSIIDAKLEGAYMLPTED